MKITAPFGTIDELAGLARSQAKPAEKHPGLYLLFQGDALVYVGESIDAPGRINAHVRARDVGETGGRYTKRIAFDRAAWFPIADPRERADLEVALILRFDPPFNKQFKGKYAKPRHWRPGNTGARPAQIS